MKHKYLYGYVNDERVVIRNNVRQIVAFIMKHQYSETLITTLLDEPVLSTVVGGFIMSCPDQAFLREQLLPVLAPVQMGIKRVPKFMPVPEDLITFSNERRL
jgi:hypothetical protein